MVAARHIGDYAFKCMQLAGFATCFGTRLQHIAELDFFRARTKQNNVLYRFGQVLKRGFQIESVMLGQALQHGEVIRVALVPAFDGATGQAERGESNDAGGVKKGLFAQALARRTRTQRRVKRKQARLKLANGVVAMRTGKTGVESLLDAAVHV